VIDSLGLCLFTSFALTADDYTDLFNAIVGEKETPEGITLTGERIWNLERIFNLAAGIDKAQDTLPKRLLKEPISEGPAKGQVHRLDELLPDYYQQRGWSDDGVPTEDTKVKLGLG